MKIYKLLLLLLIVFTCSGLLAGDHGIENVFDYGAGARAMGLGNGYTALADDSSSIYWNPAGLGILKHNELMLLHTSLFYNTYYNFFSFAYPTLKTGTIGLGIFRIGTGDIIFRDSHNIVTEENISFQQYQFLIGYGISLSGLPISAGGAIKINSFSLSEYSGSSISFDAGILLQTYGSSWEKIAGKYSLDNFKIGLNVKNFVSTSMKLNASPEAESINVKLGALYFINITRDLNHKLLFTFDVNFYKNKSPKLNGGFEYNLFKIGFLRAGYNQNIGIVTGAGIEYWNIRFDYSLAFQEIDMAHRISALWRFGKGIEEKRQDEEVKTKEETDQKIKIALDKESSQYKEKMAKLEEGQKKRIADMENQQKVSVQKAVEEMTLKYGQEKQKLIDDMNIKFKEDNKKSITEERQKLLLSVSNRYEQEKQKLLSSYSNKFAQEKEILSNQLKADFEEQKKELQKKITADEEYQRKHFTLGVKLYEKGDFDAAITELETVLRMNPNNLEAEDYLKMAKASKRDASTYPKEIMDIYYRGIDLYAAGKYQNAIDEWKKILKIDPYNKLAVRNITDAEQKLKKLEELKKSEK